MELIQEDIDLAEKYISYVKVWKQTGEYGDEVMEMKKHVKVSYTDQPTVYDVWVNDRHGSIVFGPMEMRWKEKELDIIPDYLRFLD